MHRSHLSPVRSRRIAPRTPVAATTGAAPLPFVSVPMNTNTRKTLGAVGALWLAFAATAYSAAPAEAAPVQTETQKTDPQLIRGRYLVEHIGLCADCHSPRNEKGEFVREQWLKGAALPFQPMVPMPWAQAAPPLAGLPSMTTEQAVTFMQTGKRPDGTTPRPPMPEFRFNEADANAVVAYLKSLAK